MTGPAPSSPARPGDISALLGWCLDLMRQGAAADPAEIAAYQQAKARLLDQIAAARAADDPELASRARQAAARARHASGGVHR
jgi:hypothetical protein